MRRLCSLLLLIALAACRPGPVSASPAPYGARLEAVGDTIKITLAPCAVAGSAVGCRVTLAGTVGQTPINFGAIPDFAPGESRVIAKSITCTANAVISITGASQAVNASGVPGPVTNATPGVLTCADPVPGAPGAWTIILQVIVPSP